MRCLNKRFALAYLFGILPSVFASSFLDNYYSSAVEVLLLSAIAHTFASLFLYYLFGRIAKDLRLTPVDAGMSIALFTALTVFLAAVMNLLGRFPSLFDTSTLRFAAGNWLYFSIGLIAALPASIWTLSLIQTRRLRLARIRAFVDANLGGLLVGIVFFLVYFLLASAFNQPVFEFDDIFFDTDSNLWRWRFATDHYQDYYTRTVHPFVLIIVRPFVALMGFFLKGDTLYASFAVIALTGALCVFLVWYFAKNAIGGSLYALLIAALFGASASQLVFGSLLETYGFLGAVALIFIVLLLRGKPLYMLVITGLAAFGITVSNLAQTVIAHFFVKRDIKQLIKYGLIVGALVVPLNLLNNFIYPDAHPYMWDLSTLTWEEKNVFPPTLQRANYLGRVMALHSVVAPEPLLMKEDIPFIKVWMFRASLKKAPMRIAQYENWLGSSLSYLWTGFVAFGVLLFLKNIFKQDNRFSFAFILTILFYFALHLRYGRDVFLYSSNWTYAIILTLALAWKEVSERRWFQIALLVFIMLLLANNFKLLLTMLTVSVLHIS